MINPPCSSKSSYSFSFFATANVSVSLIFTRLSFIKAIDKDTGKEVQGFYFEYPETSYCFTEDYEKSPVEMIPCVVFYTMTDWGLPNKPVLCQNIDKDSIKLIRFVDISLVIIFFTSHKLNA